MANYNKFRRNGNLTSKTNTPPKFIIKDEEFPALGNSSFISDSNNNIENFRSVLLTQQIRNDETEKRKIKYGWIDLSFENDHMGKIIKSYNKNYILDKTENEDEEDKNIYETDPYKFNLLVSNAIDCMICRWENYINKYNELFGEGAYEEFYKIGSEYMQIDDYSSDDEE